MTLTLSSCGTGGGQQFPSEVQDDLNAAVDALMQKYRVPGAIIGAWVPGEGEWIVGKGKANTATGEAPGTDDHVRIASITKTFTATVILQLVDEGKLKLDDKLAQYDLGVTVPNSEEITIRNLLNMTSGLFNYTADETFWDTYTQDPEKAWAPRELVELAAAHGVVSPPGLEFDYNNTNYVLLGLLIEKITGNPAGEEITTRIIDKLGMKNTTYPEGNDMPSPFMNGYMPDPDGENGAEATIDVSIESPTVGYTAGAIISNLEDIKTWLDALKEGTLISPEMHEEQLTFEAPNTPSYGLGVMGAQGWMGHSGEILGYNNTALTQDKEDGVSIIVFLNRYPNEVEGVPEQILGAVAEALAPVVQK
jgi:D-alanyl-D-alanine carboxypeptidase